MTKTIFWRCLLLLPLGAAACAPSDPQPFEQISAVSVDAPAMVSGGGSSDVIAYGAWDAYGLRWPIRFLRHDAAHPDELTDLGTIDPGWYGYGVDPTALALSGTRAVAAEGATVTVVDFTDPDLLTTTFQLSSPATAVLADGRWLLAATGSSLELVDTTAPTTRFTAAAPSQVDSLLAIASGFVAFTDTGYVRVEPDAISPSFVASTSESVRAFRRAFADGSEAVAAGPATGGGVRIVRLDVSVAAAPFVKKEAVFDGAYGSFAWDGGETSTLEIQGEVGAGLYQGYVIREAAGGFSGTRVAFPLLWWRGTEMNVAAHAARLFLIHEAGSTGGVDLLSFYRIR